MIEGLALPDSIKIYDDMFFVSESGINNYSVFDRDFKVIKNGISLKSLPLREPVNVTPAEKGIFICDWFNHRLLLENDKGIEQIGIPGKFCGRFRNLIFFLKSMGLKPTYTKSHFSGSQSQPAIFDMRLFFQSLYYYLTNLNLIVDGYKNNLFLNKPNDCVYLDEKLFITQKNNRCLTQISFKSGNIDSVNHHLKYSDNKRLGRLGHCCAINHKVYFCDETNHRIGILDNYGISFISLPDEILPFSITSSQNQIIFSSKNSIYIYSETHDLVSSFNINGEIHGICSDNRNIFIADRLNGCIWKKGI